MKFIRAKDFTASKAWGSNLLASFEGTSAKLHWTDQPYRWHTNTGTGLFAVLDGEIDMHYRKHGCEEVIKLQAGDVLTFFEGEEHVAHPVGEARILVVEKDGSD